MIFRTSHIRLFKSLTLALLAFYGMATGRSLLPDLCTTLASRNDRHEAAETAEACCASSRDSSKADRIGAPVNLYATCALCNLTESLSNPIVYSHELLAHIEVEPANTLAAAEPSLPHVWTPAALRAPPVFA